MFVLTVGHVDMITYPQTILLKEFILFIGLYYWSVHGHVYSNSWRYKRNYFHISIDILFYNLNTMKKHQTFIPRSFLQWRSWFGASPPPQATIWSYAQYIKNIMQDNSLTNDVNSSFCPLFRAVSIFIFSHYFNMFFFLWSSFHFTRLWILVNIF